ncbi:hypothetical protein GCM10023318_42170 [Nocardia callitridis]|uniref:Transposase n=1 Tax=Nocardia callitridis TaxID=648753 RepID=A0ABP9KNX6_9NOCA
MAPVEAAHCQARIKSTGTTQGNSADAGKVRRAFGARSIGPGVLAGRVATWTSGMARSRVSGGDAHDSLLV